MILISLVSFTGKGGEFIFFLLSDCFELDHFPSIKKNPRLSLEL